MILFTPEIVSLLLANGEQTAKDGKGNHVPVVKLFLPGQAATWLITEAYPDHPDILFGLCRVQHKPNYVERRVMLPWRAPAPRFAAPGSGCFT